MDLLEQVSSFHNLHLAFLECSRGKRKTRGYMDTLFEVGEKLLSIHRQLREGKYCWGKYREFYVTDPKQRLVMAAPFVDRIVHHAIHRVIEPIIDVVLSDSVFACRKGKGNRYAVLYLKQAIDIFGSSRYVIKLDVKKYFMSISHEILMREMAGVLPDSSLNKLLKTLLESYPLYAKVSRGIPIGNLTSQLFANFYLSSADKLACHMLNLDYNWLQNKSRLRDGFYIRYMDDLVILAPDKKQARSVVNSLLQHIFERLDLDIPFSKRICLANDPVPFLGYVLSEEYVKALARNHRRYKKHVRRLQQKGALPSQQNQVRVSYEAWCNIEKGKKPDHTLQGCLRARSSVAAIGTMEPMQVCSPSI